MLTLHEYIVVDIPDYVYIHDLKKWGPLSKQLVKVSTLINLLNKNIQVKIPEKHIRNVYALVSTYNEMARATKGEHKVADTAQENLEQELRIKVQREDGLRLNESNPFTTPEIATANVQNPIFVPVAKRSKKSDAKTRKRLYEVIGTEEVPHSTQGFSESTKFDDIDFSDGLPIQDVE